MSLTTQEFLNKLQRVRLNLSEDDTPLRIASYSVIAKQSERIFDKGLNANGQEIGQYSTDDIWLNPQETASRKNFKPAGKPETKIIKRGINKGKEVEFRQKKKFAKNKFTGTKIETDRKTRWFQGWKGFREEQGLPTDNVKLEVTGELFSDFCNPQGNVPTTRKVSNTERVTSLRKPLSVKKLAGAEDRYKAPIGTLTSDERQTFFDTVRFEMRKLIKGI